MDTPSLTVSETDGVTVVSLHARELVEHTVNALRPQLLRQIPAGPVRWVLDLSEAEFVASAGMGLIIQVAHKLSTTGGKCAVCTSRPEVMRLFHGPHFLAAVEIYGSLQEAVHAVAPK